MASLLKRYGWHEWLCHTNFSFLQGASSPEEYVDTAVSLGYSGIGITDINGLYGVVRSFRKRRALILDDQFKLTYGAEINLEDDHRRPLFLQNTIVLKALTHRGYYNLCRILSRLHDRGKHDASISIDNLFTSDVSDLIAILPMRGLIGLQKEYEVKKRCALLKELFGQSLYLALGDYLTLNDRVWFLRLYELSQRLGVSCLLSQDCFMHHGKRKPLLDVLQAIKRCLPLDQCGAYLWPNDQRHMLSLMAIEQRYENWPGYERALSNSYHLVQKFNFDLSQLKYNYPKEFLPPGLTGHSYLEQQVWQMASRVYRGEIPIKVKDSLKHELVLVNDLKFADYFLTVWDIVRWARSQGILCQGRGSAANSAICYVLGITSVDPAVFDLLAERFISMERGDPPDIDVDFEHERREEVIQYIYRRYGRKRAAMVANVITFKRRGALRFSGQALGVPNETLNAAAKFQGRRDMRELSAVTVLEELSKRYPDMRLPWKLWGRVADALVGFPRHLGLHCGGFVVSDQELDWLVPQEPATMPGRTVIAWSKDDIEALGFFKIDVLSLGMLTAIRKCFSYIDKWHGRSYSLASIPQEDKKTYEMLQRADTVGTFQVESRAQMAMLPRLRPHTFYDLVVQVGIVRPGPLQGGFVHPYINRRMGCEQVEYAHPALRPILQRTLGIPIFQEQIMRIAIAVGGFSPGQADELRRQMGAWQFRGDLAPLVKQLAVGMRARGIDESFVQQILRQVKGFAEYGFPESHAISFALIAYASSYLRCHYLAAFTTALLNSQPMGFYSPHSLIQDAKRNGVKILAVSVIHSDWDHRVEQLRDGSFAIRLGMRIIKGLRESVARVFEGFEREKWKGWLDFQSAVCQGGGSDLNRLDVSLLAASDAFAVLGIKRRDALWQAAAWSVDGRFLEDESDQGGFAAESSWERMDNDFSALETSLSKHPAALLRQEYWSYPVSVECIVTSRKILECSSNQRVWVFGLVIVRQAPPSAKGMVFITLEDESGFINLVLRAHVYKEFASAVSEQGFICARGTLQSQQGSQSVMVDSVLAPQGVSGRLMEFSEGEPSNQPGNALTEDGMAKVRNFH